MHISFERTRPQRRSLSTSSGRITRRDYAGPGGELSGPTRSSRTGRGGGEPGAPNATRDTFELAPHQRDLANRTGIPEQRFDPNYWRNDNYGSGARPPDKIIWDSWTPEQRAQAGLPTWTEYKEAATAWRRHVAEQQRTQDREIVQQAQQLGLDLNNEGDFIRAMNAAGIHDRPDEGRAGYRRRLAAFRGQMDSSGRYHFLPDGRTVDVATSDLNVRGRPIMRPDVIRRTGPGAALGEAWQG